MTRSNHILCMYKSVLGILKKWCSPLALCWNRALRVLSAIWLHICCFDVNRNISLCTYCLDSVHTYIIILYYIIYSQIKFAKNTCNRCLMCAIKVSFSAYNCKHLFILILPKRRYNAILSLET